MAGYDFDVGEFLYQDIRDQAMGGDQLLLALSCMIMKMCLAVGVQEIPGINEIFEATNTTNLRMIRDTANLLARKATRREDIVK